MAAAFHRLAIVGTVLLAQGCATIPPSALSGGRDLPAFRQVDEGLYRGGQPSRAGLEQVHRMGIKTVMCLRQPSKAMDEERRLVEQMGMRWVNIPMWFWWRPSDQQVQQFLTIVDDSANRPVFVHCRQGWNRAGIMTAIYRVVRQGWEPHRAYAEARQLGLIPWNLLSRHLVLHEALREYAVSPAPSPGKLQTIVALGDSTTAGTPGFQSPVEAPPDGRGDPQSQYAYWMMQRHPEWRVVNRGVNGERTDDMLRRFARDVAAQHPQVVIILAGVNDLYEGDPASRIIEQLQALYTRATEQDVTVVACTIMPYAGMNEAQRTAMAQVNTWIRDYSASHGLLFCDLFSVLRDPASPWQLKDSPDGLHPDVAGYRAMGEALTGVLERWLRSQ